MASCDRHPLHVGDGRYYVSLVHRSDGDGCNSHVLLSTNGEYAYADMKYLEHDVPFGMFLRNMHRWAALMVITVCYASCFLTGHTENNWVVELNPRLTLLLVHRLSFWTLPCGQYSWNKYGSCNTARMRVVRTKLDETTFVFFCWRYTSWVVGFSLHCTLCHSGSWLSILASEKRRRFLVRHSQG